MWTVDPRWPEHFHSPNAVAPKPTVISVWDILGLSCTLVYITLYMLYPVCCDSLQSPRRKNFVQDSTFTFDFCSRVQQRRYQCLPPVDSTDFQLLTFSQRIFFWASRRSLLFWSLDFNDNTNPIMSGKPNLTETTQGVGESANVYSGTSHRWPLSFSDMPHSLSLANCFQGIGKNRST